MSTTNYMLFRPTILPLLYPAHLLLLLLLAVADFCRPVSLQAAEPERPVSAPQQPAPSKPAPKGEAQPMNMPGMNMPGMSMPSAQPAPGAAPTEFTVPVERQQQFGVTYTTAQTTPLRKTLRTVGLVTYEKQRRLDFVSRVDGYVQQLNVASSGQIVEQNQSLLTIYSPALLTTEREFITALQALDQARTSGAPAVLDNAQRLVDSAKLRLQLWNITGPQVAELERTRTPSLTLMFSSPFRGVIQDLPIAPGQRVAAGDRLVDLVDLSVVWVWAEFYQTEVSLLKTGMPVLVKAAAFPGAVFTGKVAVIDPFINPATRTTRARIDLENPDFKLRPDMYVSVELAVDLGTGLTIPLSAVMPTGQRNLVFLDKGQGRLEPRFIELGGQYGTNYLVSAGLKPGERIVNSANFLIDSEANLQDALRQR